MHIRGLKRALITAAAAATLTLGVSTAALASDNGNGATLYAGNYQCGGATHLDNAEGFVNFHADGNQLTLIVHIKNALPNTVYNGFLYDETCTPDNGGIDLQITTNANGVGNGTVTVTAHPGATYFYTLYNANAFTVATSLQTQGITP